MPASANARERLDRDPGVGGRAGPGRDHEPVGAALEQLGHLGLVVADDVDLRSQLAEVLDEVVGERVVVVDYEDLHGQSGCLAASSTALKIAVALVTDSSYS